MSPASLPLDILLLICDVLGDTHPPSVRAFALVCRKWASISNVYLHRSISFAVSDIHHLKRDVDSCLSTLEQSAALGSVRRLEVAGPGPYNDPSNIISPSPGWRRAPYEDFGESMYKINHKEHPFSIKSRIGQIRKFETLANASWQPLALLIRQLPGLKDVIWNSSQPVSPCVLSAMEAQAPPGRLWINTFSFRNLHGPALQPSESKLIISPCLYAIRLNFVTAWPASDGRSVMHAYDEEAVMRLVSGVSPGLKKVSLSPQPPFAMPFYTEKLPWKGFHTNNPLPDVIQGSLHTLRIENRGLSPESLDVWNACTDFNTLQTLILPPDCMTAVFENLSRLPLRGLQSLSMFIGRQVRTSRDLIDAAQRFLTSMAPLSTLRIEQQVHRLRMGPIIQHHATNLTRLWLLQSTDGSEEPRSWSERYTPTFEVLSDLRQHCPNLIELAIPIRRSKGNKTEVQLYRMLGSLPKLQSLDLTLDCSDYSVLWAYENDDDGEDDLPEPPCDPSFDFFEKDHYPWKFPNNEYGIRNGYIRNGFINCAVDEVLALSIFQCISMGKPAESRPLERLTIKVRNGVTFGMGGSPTPSSIRKVVDFIKRDWSLSRCVRDDRRDDILVNDITSTFTPNYGSTSRSEDKAVADLLERLWPNTNNKEDWWKTEWRSLPLDV